MTRFAIVAIAILATTAVAAADPPKRPNLVFVLTDDQARWAAGCYGNPDAKTPNLDQIAKEGARFASAFVVTPVCSPSRASYLTGRHGIELGVTDFINPQEHAAGVGLPEGIPTWPKLLQETGYKTALFGKWHLGGRPHQHPNRCGFDHFLGEPRGSYAIRDAKFDRNGSPFAVEGFTVDALTDHALAWVRENRDRPFAVCVHYREPHTPYGPMPPQDQAVYKDVDPTVPDGPGMDREYLKRQTRQYLTAVAAVDRNVGRMLDELDRLKLADSTVVIFTSDHGYNIGHHGIQHKGNGHWVAGGVRGPKRPNMWDTSLMVPLLIRWPGVVKPGTVVPEVVANIDTLPSVCGILGVPVPKDVKHHGLDYSRLLRGEKVTDWRAELYGAYDLHNGGLAYMRMVRTADWKLVRHLRSSGLDELYDLRADPGETTNLYAAPKAAAAKEALGKKLTAWRQAVSDPVRE